MSGTFDNDIVAVFPDSIWREDRLHRNHLIFEQVADRLLPFEMFAVVDGVAPPLPMPITIPVPPPRRDVEKDCAIMG